MIQESDKIYTQQPDEKVKADSGDATAGYLADKIDTSTLDVDTTNHLLKVKDNTFLLLSGGNITGQLKISGTSESDGYLYAGTTDPSGTTRLNYSGYFYATRVYNTVYNDIADFIPVPNELTIEYGKVYKRHKDYTMGLTQYYMDDFIGIASDTYGYGLGKSKYEDKIPIAIAGFVLAYVDSYYSPGTPLVATADGYLTAGDEDLVAKQPWKVVATYDRPEYSKYWHDVEVKGRHWVKIR